MNKVVVVIFVASMMMMPVFAAVAKNVLRNGCFDLGDDPVTLIPYGWTAPQENSLPHEKVDHSTRLKAHSPPAHLWGSNTHISSLHQVIQLSELQAKGNNRVLVLLSFYHTSFHISDDAVNATVSYVRTRKTTSVTEMVEAIRTPILFSRDERTWQLWRSDWFELPMEVESLIVEVACVRYINQNCDGYLDDVCLYMALLSRSEKTDLIELPDTCECLLPNATISSLFFGEASTEGVSEPKTMDNTTFDAELRLRYVHRLLIALVIVTIVAVIIRKRNELYIHIRERRE